MGENIQLKRISDHESNHLLRSLAIGAIILIVFLSLPHFCSAECGHSHDHHDHHHHHDHDHDHDHGHHDEPASFKWTKKANEIYEEEQHHHHDSHHHSHSHGSHGHEAPKNVQSK